MTPTRLASFYRSVGGNYDTLFLETPEQSLSFIYQSLGCVHTLQPTKDDFAPPAIPSLTPRGFVRWQMIQLLLGPEEFVPYLQEAVRKFDLVDPTTGRVFPKLLPKDSFPDQPDPEMVNWHNAVFESLQRDAQEEMSGHPRDAGMRSCSGTPAPPNAPDATDYFSSHDAYRNANGRANEAFAAPPGTPYYQDNNQRGARHNRRRRRSYPEQVFAVPTSIPTPSPGNVPGNRRGPSDADLYFDSFSTQSRSASSSVFDEDDRSVVLSDTSSRSSSPTIHRSRGPHHHHRRRHSDDDIKNPRQHLPPVFPDDASSTDSNFSDDDSSPSLSTSLPVGYFASPTGGRTAQYAPPRVNYRGANVRWSNENSLWEFPPPGGNSAASTPASEIPPTYSSRGFGNGDGAMLWNGTGSGAHPKHHSREGKKASAPDMPYRSGSHLSASPNGDGRDRNGVFSAGGRPSSIPHHIRPQIRRLVSPVLGVHGRRYPAEGIVWR